MSEISGENSAELEKRYRATIIIISAQIFVALILVFVSLLVVSKPETLPDSQDFSTVWIAVLFIAIGSFLLRRLFFSWERLKNIALLKGVPGLLRTLQTNSVILGIMAEIVAVAGFVIAVLSGNSSDMIRAGAISLVVFLINFPRKNVWKKIVSNLEKV
jgi:cytochrome c biogenesis protein CcdA